MGKILFYDDRIINVLLEQERPSGGAAVQTYGWIRGFAEEGHEVFVMTDLHQHGAIKSECRDIRLVPIYNPVKGLRWLRWVYYRIPFIYRQVRKVRPDYLYQSVPEWTSFVLAVICRILGVKLLVRISNDYLVDDRIRARYSRIYCFLLGQGFKLSHAVLCQNEYQHTILQKRFPEKLIIRVSNPIYKQYTGVSNVQTKSGSYIAWIGLFQYQKNLELLYEIASLLPDQQFEVAGKEERKCDAKTLSYLAKLKELPNVKFAGFLDRESILVFLSRARFLLNTSHYEGFSNTFLEAMSAGTPILSTPGVNPDGIIDSHGLGIIYHEARDLDQRLNAMTPAEYSKLSATVSEYVSRHHNYRDLTRKLSGILEANANVRFTASVYGEDELIFYTIYEPLNSLA